MSRRKSLSYQPAMVKIPKYLNRYFLGQNYLLVYPLQSENLEHEKIDLTNSSLIEAIEGIDVIGKTIAHIFRKR